MAAILSDKGKECQALRAMQHRDPVAFNENFRKVWSPFDPYFFSSKDYDPERYEHFNDIRPETVKTNRVITRFKDGVKQEFYKGFTFDGYATYVPKEAWETHIKNIIAPSNGTQAN